MATKLEQVTSYIRNLKVGTKISIKGIAAELSVSDGTAYHAIKKAEREGLVVTLPKAGTTRVEGSSKNLSEPITITKLIHITNASLLTKTSIADFVVSHLFVADSTPSELKHLLHSSGPNCICIIGDRPDLQLDALSLGAHLLLTSGCRPTPEVLSAAEQHDGIILQTGLSTFHVLNAINKSSDSIPSFFAPIAAKIWMQHSQYLYVDDLAIDARNLFDKILAHYIPVVDHNMHIYGMLSAAAAYSADPVRRVDRLCSTSFDFPTIQENDSITLAAKHLLSNEKIPVLVTNENQLIGVLTVSELLKFYQHYGLSPSSNTQELLFQTTTSCSKSGEQVYSLHIPNASAKARSPKGDQMVSLMLSAARKYCEEKNIFGTIQNLSFYFTNDIDIPDISLSLKVASATPFQHVIEFEIYAQDHSCARGLMTIQLDYSDTI